MGAPEKLASVQLQTPEQVLAELTEWLSPVFQELSKSGLRITSLSFGIGVLVSNQEGFAKEKQSLLAQISALQAENKHLAFRVKNLSDSLDVEARRREQELARAAINAGQNKSNQWSPPPIKKEAFA